jgi:hypothetical protein
MARIPPAAIAIDDVSNIRRWVTDNNLAVALDNLNG